MINAKWLLFSMGLMGVLESGCGMEAGRAACSGSTASLQILPNGVADGSEKQWQCSNFRFAIEGLPTSRIAALDGRIVMAHPRPVEGRVAMEHPKVRVPDLKLTISMADYPAWAEAAKKWFIDGQHLDLSETPATLSLLGPDLQEELVTVRFTRLGVLAITQGGVAAGPPEGAVEPPPSEAQEEQYFTVELIAEETVIN
jgi:hypothetical protein